MPEQAPEYVSNSGQIKIYAYRPQVITAENQDDAARKILQIKSSYPDIKITNILDGEGNSLLPTVKDAVGMNDNPGLPKFLEERLK